MGPGQVSYSIGNQLYTPFRVTLEFILNASQLKYVLGSAQQLNKPSVRFNQVIAYWTAELTESISGNTIAALKTYQSAYLTLQDPGSNNIIQQDSLARYLPNTEIKEIIKINYQQVDFTKSFFEFPNNVQPTSDAGNSMQLIIEYIDLNYPLMAPAFPMASSAGQGYAAVQSANGSN